MVRYVDAKEEREDSEPVPPSPRRPVCKSTSEKRSNDTRNAIGGTNNTSVCGSLWRRDDEGDDGVAACQHASGSDTDNGPADNQGDAVLRNGADQAPHLKNTNRDHEDELEVEVFVRLAPHGLGGADSQEHGRAVPADLVEVSAEILDNVRGRI